MFQLVLDEIRASTDLEVAKLRQAKDAVVAAVRDESFEQTERLKAETNLYCSRKLNEAKLQVIDRCWFFCFRAEAANQVARNEAAAEEAKAEAEGIIAPMLEKKNLFVIDQRKLEVYKALASNPQLVLSDSTSPELNTMMLCDAILQNSKGPTATRSELLAEMMVMSKVR